MLGVRTDADLTEPFWEASNRDVLVRPVCNACQQNFFSPQVVCPSCQSADWDYQPSSGRGRVYSHTTVHRSPTPKLQSGYVVADVELDEGWRMFAWVVNCEPTDVVIDMAVRVHFVDGPRGSRLPAFEPAAGS